MRYGASMLMVVLVGLAVGCGGRLRPSAPPTERSTVDVARHELPPQKAAEILPRWTPADELTPEEAAKIPTLTPTPAPAPDPAPGPSEASVAMSRVPWEELPPEVWAWVDSENSLNEVLTKAVTLGGETYAVLETMDSPCKEIRVVAVKASPANFRVLWRLERSSVSKEYCEVAGIGKVHSAVRFANPKGLPVNFEHLPQ